MDFGLAISLYLVYGLVEEKIIVFFLCIVKQTDPLPILTRNIKLVCLDVAPDMSQGNIQIVYSLVTSTE